MRATRERAFAETIERPDGQLLVAGAYRGLDEVGESERAEVDEILVIHVSRARESRRVVSQAELEYGKRGLGVGDAGALPSIDPFTAHRLRGRASLSLAAAPHKVEQVASS